MARFQYLGDNVPDGVEALWPGASWWMWDSATGGLYECGPQTERLLPEPWWPELTELKVLEVSFCEKGVNPFARIALIK